MRTAESVVLTDWPPGPEERKTSTRMSLSGMSTSVASSMSGMTSTAANDVWRLSAEPNGLMRARRGVPASTEIVPKAQGAPISKAADLMPPPSAYEVSMTFTGYL